MLSCIMSAIFNSTRHSLPVWLYFDLLLYPLYMEYNICDILTLHDRHQVQLFLHFIIRVTMQKQISENLLIFFYRNKLYFTGIIQHFIIFHYYTQHNLGTVLIFSHKISKYHAKQQESKRDRRKEQQQFTKHDKGKQRL